MLLRAGVASVLVLVLLSLPSAASAPKGHSAVDDKAKAALAKAAQHDRAARRYERLRKAELRRKTALTRAARRKLARIRKLSPAGPRASLRAVRTLLRRARWHGKRVAAYARKARWHRAEAARLRKLASYMWPRRPLGAAANWEEFQTDERLRNTYLRNFNQLTPENELKWDRIHEGILRWDFAVADQVVDWALAHGKRVRGHTLIWSSQNPWWVEQGVWTRATLLAVMRDHIRKAMEHFKGRIREWDVVNEAFDVNGNYTDNIWYRVIGTDYVEQAFRMARAADPSVKLYYNEMGGEVPDHPQTVAVRKMAQDFRRRGVPIDGVGIQGHVANSLHAQQSELTETMRRLADLELDVAITEMDVRTDGGGTRDQERQKQTQIYSDYAQACRMQPRCTSFTTWGISDKYSWWEEPGAPANPPPGAEWAPLPFDADMNAKPAFGVLEDWIKRP
jgi:GH35 family endo-1,4-beta-xylanase